MGSAIFPILDENTYPNPKTPYQKSKYRKEPIVTSELGCIPKSPFEKGIAQTIEWYKSQGKI